MNAPDHHHPNGGFRNPWALDVDRGTGFLRWQWERLRDGIAPTPAAAAFPTATSAVAYPYAGRDELRLTWVGHATFLVQIGGLNLLTDPVWSRRVSPVRWAGPRRMTEPGLPFDALPPIDAVLLSHDHYDHLDAPTVTRLRERGGEGTVWFTPLGYRRWFRRRGVTAVTELDWWESAGLETEAGVLRIGAAPARHWSQRAPFGRGRRLWCSWSVRVPDGPAFYFGGDTGYHPTGREIARRYGGFDALALPIGAYEPRWFMRRFHCNPEDAVRLYRELGGTGLFAGMHWGAFRLSDEHPLEPPTRTREEWQAAGLPAELLWLPAVGETRTVAFRRVAVFDPMP